MALASAAVVLTPFAGLSETYSEADRSEDYEGRKALEAVATKTRLDATVIHHRSPLWYMNLVEGRRRDIQLVASFEIGLNNREIEAAKATLRTGTPTYILYPNVSDAESIRETGLDLVPVEERTLYEMVLRDGAGVRESQG